MDNRTSSTRDSLTEKSPSRPTSPRLQDMKSAWQAYCGNANPPLMVRAGEADDNLILSFGRTIVDKGVSFLFGKDVVSQVEVPGDPSIHPGTQQSKLYIAWECNN